MELLVGLNVGETTDFFDTFFRLPRGLWDGFLASRLSSVDLIGFALYVFAIAPINIKLALMTHLATSPAGAYFVKTYAKALGGERDD